MFNNLYQNLCLIEQYCILFCIKKIAVDLRKRDMKGLKEGIIYLHNPWHHVSLFPLRNESVYTMWLTWLNQSLL